MGQKGKTWLKRGLVFEVIISEPSIHPLDTKCADFPGSVSLEDQMEMSFGFLRKKNPRVFISEINRGTLMETPGPKNNKDQRGARKGLRRKRLSSSSGRKT